MGKSSQTIFGDGFPTKKGWETIPRKPFGKPFPKTKIREISGLKLVHHREILLQEADDAIHVLLGLHELVELVEVVRVVFLEVDGILLEWLHAEAEHCRDRGRVISLWGVVVDHVDLLLALCRSSALALDFLVKFEAKTTTQNSNDKTKT